MSDAREELQGGVAVSAEDLCGQRGDGGKVVVCALVLLRVRGRGSVGECTFKSGDGTGEGMSTLMYRGAPAVVMTRSALQLCSWRPLGANAVWGTSCSASGIVPFAAAVSVCQQSLSA